MRTTATMAFGVVVILRGSRRIVWMGGLLASAEPHPYGEKCGRCLDCNWSPQVLLYGRTADTVLIWSLGDITQVVAGTGVTICSGDGVGRGATAVQSVVVEVDDDDEEL